MRPNVLELFHLLQYIATYLQHTLTDLAVLSNSLDQGFPTFFTPALIKNLVTLCPLQFIIKNEFSNIYKGFNTFCAC